ncbi:helix-turn-helix domain-containing protein [Rhodovarius crocodyli]|uniref:Helix-turn-helix domain-containing protein n=1 Tax=Rhodovarius crocodyli TaxID=1979269 RepID=A0A437MDQ5_9PROT|nr:helix-turn-helix domain-containing protein [Rhodovarius crocodyli]RVT95782.1 helix-turn-helix domain-containing protein [Rhodovarius crocodyli]
MEDPRRVLILGMAPVQLLDLAGPAEVLAQAGRLQGMAQGRPPAPLYDVACHVIPVPGLAQTSAGLAFRPTETEASLLGIEALDTLIVIGGEGAREHSDDRRLHRLLHHLAPRARRLVGVCTGAFSLAAAGLLQGRRVTTHWRFCAELARRHPDLTVDPDPIFIRDGDVWTSAGVTAGMDLMLALVEEDHGHALALSVARELVLFLRRPGDQKQFSSVLAAQSRGGSRLGGLMAWLAGNLEKPVSVEAMAERACLSPRQFARVFREETGLTPARFLERMRVEAARQRLETGRGALATVVRSCGFGTEETMRRAFLRQLGASPGDYRDRFHRRQKETHA